LGLRKSFAGKQKSTLGPFSKSRQKKVGDLGAKEEVRAAEGDLGAISQGTKPESTLFYVSQNLGLTFFA
jgi:hypothetical protein